MASTRHESHDHGNGHANYTAFNKRMVEQFPVLVDDNTLEGALMAAYVTAARYQDGNGTIRYHDAIGPQGIDPATLAERLKEAGTEQIGLILYGLPRAELRNLQGRKDPNGNSIVDTVRDLKIHTLTPDELAKLLGHKSLDIRRMAGFALQSGGAYLGSLHSDAIEKEFADKDVSEMVAAMVELHSAYHLEGTTPELRERLKEIMKGRGELGLRQEYTQLLAQAGEKFKQGLEDPHAHTPEHPAGH